MLRGSKSLILTSNFSGWRLLKAIIPQTDSILLPQELLFSPLPANGDGQDFYRNHKTFLKNHDYHGVFSELDDELFDPFTCIKSNIDEFKTIELWIDPSLGSYVASFHFLYTVKDLPHIRSRLKINWLARTLAFMNDEQILSVQLAAIDTIENDFEEASKFWLAYRHDTPEKWFDLRHYKALCFKHWRIFNFWMLLQLPSKKTGLRQIENEILSLTKHGLKTSHIVGTMLGNNLEPPKYLSDSNLFSAIETLSTAIKPALTNIYLSHMKADLRSEDADRAWRLFCTSNPKLTPLGKKLLEEKTHWRNHNLTNLWWGGTHISDTNYWTFDPKSEKLEFHR